jgi:hypothetical protein
MHAFHQMKFASEWSQFEGSRLQFSGLLQKCSTEHFGEALPDDCSSISICYHLSRRRKLFQSNHSPGRQCHLQQRRQHCPNGNYPPAVEEYLEEYDRASVLFFVIKMNSASEFPYFQIGTRHHFSVQPKRSCSPIKRLDQASHTS